MANNIAGLGTGRTATTGLNPRGDGRRTPSARFLDPNGTAEGGKYPVQGKIDLAHGEFDFNAPRGTYLDILV